MITRSPVSSAVKAALAPPVQPHQFGLVPSMPAETCEALRQTHTEIVERLHSQDTARQALVEWLEALHTARLVADQIELGVNEVEAHIEDAIAMSGRWKTSRVITIDAALSERLAHAEGVLDAIYSIAPQMIVVACAVASEAAGVESEGGQNG